MNLQTLELLDPNTEIVTWIERQLASEELPAVVAELLGWNVATDEAASLESALGNRLPQILESGLSESDARVLLRSPRLLFDLQEAICFHGGPYWMAPEGKSGNSSGMGENIPPNLNRIVNFLDNQPPTLAETLEKPSKSNGSGYAVAPGKEDRRQVTLSSEPAFDSQGVRAKASSPAPRSGNWLWRTLPILALVLVAGFGILLLNRTVPPEPNHPSVEVASNNSSKSWGLNDLKPLLKIERGDEYLNAVASAMNDWKESPPIDSAMCAQRIQELIEGCQNLIEEAQLELSPLDAERRKWLHAKCTAWIEKFREDLVAIHQDPESWQEVTRRMDAKVEKAVTVIRAEAETLREAASA